MADPSASLHEQVTTLNENIEAFDEFSASNGHHEEFPKIHFIGSIDPHRAEEALIDHWDDFLQYSRNVLNTDDVPREAALGHIDTINLDYKRVLSAVQKQRQ